MSGDDHAAPPDPTQNDGQDDSLFRSWVKRAFALTPWGLERRVAGLQRAHEHISSAIQTIQNELAEVRDRRLEPVEKRTDNLEVAIRGVSGEIERLRDEVVPASIERSDALLERVAEEIEEVASLTERVLLGEPLPVAGTAPVDEGRLATALAEVQPLLLESFRGSEDEIAHRLDHYLPELTSRFPILDLGCGRGELLLLLRETGVAAYGVEGDPALAAAARRRGLDVVEGDVLDALRDQEAESWGAVTAIHLLEHLPPARLAAVLDEIRRVLRPGGLLIAECPNPHSLRVGGAFFWQDPTHQRPLLPETLELFVRAAGLSVERREMLHPFPDDQLLADDDGGTGAVADADLTNLAERVDRLRKRLDEIIHGPRDYAVWAAKPDNPSTE